MAEDLFNRAIEMNPKDEEVLLAIGDCYQENGDKACLRAVSPKGNQLLASSIAEAIIRFILKDNGH